MTFFPVEILALRPLLWKILMSWSPAGNGPFIQTRDPKLVVYTSLIELVGVKPRVF
jgi:hypothetical protein